MNDRTRTAVRLSVAFLMLLLAGVVHGAPELRIAPLGYQVVQIQPAPGMSRTFDVTARAAVRNLGDPAIAVTARLASSSPYFIVLDGDLSFGDVPRTAPLRPRISHDTFTLRVILPPRRQIHEFIVALHTSLTWTFACANCGGTNRPPLANAGADQTVYVAQLVALDGSASSDPDAQPLTYSWSFVTRPAGSTASLGGASSVNATFTPDREGEYIVQLLVNDGQLSSASDTVQISTLNSAPVANAGPDRNALVGEPVALDGSASSDIDGDPLTYDWAVASRPSGSTAQIVNPSQVNATFTADVAGQYLIELVVDDGTVSSTPDTMAILTTRPNTPPTANAGADQAARVGDTAQLDGSASSDADGDPLTYLWSLNTRPPSSTADLQGRTTANPTLTIDRPGTYVAQLVVRDGTTDSAPDTVNVSTINSRPVAAAGANRTVHWGATVELDGSGSSDPDGDALGFAWAILSRPDGSAAQLSDVNAPAPSFTADRPGLYVVQLVVNDGTLTSDPSNVTVTAENQVPVARDDAAATTAGVPVTIAVLANDSDADAADTLQVRSVTQPPSGAVTFTASAVQYTPANGFVGTATFTYTITDGADTATANVTVTVAAAPSNQAPTANAGADQSGYAGDVFSLDGSGSLDPEGSALTYTWSIAGGPTGGATLANASAAQASLAVSIAGTYSVQLVVNDGALASTPDVVDVVAASLPTLSIGDVTLSEGNSGSSTAAVAVSLSAPISRTVSASYATADATAGAGSDYVAASGTISFAPGSSAPQTIEISVTGDTAVEADETFLVNLTNAVNATVADGQGTVTLTNDDVSTQGVTLYAPNTLLRPSMNAGVVIQVEQPAPVGGLIANVATSNAAVARAPATVEILEGETSALFDVDAGETLGAATISVAITGVGSASLPVQVSNTTTGTLLEQAVAAGEISAEQAYVYRVFAAVGWPGLPARFRGATAPNAIDPGGRLLLDLAERFDTLSPEAQAQLAPLTIPPIYEGSWGDPAVVAAAIASAESPQPAQLASPSQPFANTVADTPAVTGAVLCRQGSLPQRLPVWGNYEVGPFRIWYLSDPLPYRSFIGTPEQSQRLAQVAAANIASIYNRLNQQFPQRPITTTHDANLPGNPCNGGDGLYDIYMYGYPGPMAEVFDYLPGTPSPSWMALNPSAPEFRDVRQILVTLAHETMHAIDGLYAKVAGQNEAYWRIEAYGTWAEDYVYGRAPQNPNYQTEHEWAKYFFEHVGPSAVGQSANVALLSLNDIGTTEDDEAYYAYSKYLFFFFLKRKFENGLPSDASLIERILVQEGMTSSMAALQEALRDRGGLRDVWPQFVAATWNDWSDGVQDDFFRWDGLRFGMRAQFDAASAWQPHRFGLQGNDERRPIVQNTLSNSTGAYVPPVGAHWELVTFPDDSTSYVVFDRRLLTTSNDFNRVQALVRIDGAWRALADWSDDDGRVRVWCRDRRAGRIQELALFFSNAAIPSSSGNQADRNWEWYDDNGDDLIPDLIASNAGCWKWTGTTSVQVDHSQPAGNPYRGAIENHRALQPVTFEISQQELEAAASSSIGNFTMIAGTNPQQPFGQAEYQVSGSILDDCTMNGGPETRSINPTGAGMFIIFSRWVPASDTTLTARVVDAFGSDPDPPRATVSCPDREDVEVTMPFPLWLALLIPDARLSEDGHQISGTFVNTQQYGFIVRSTVNFTAARE